MSETASTEMETLLARGCGFFPVRTRARKCGQIPSLASHDVGLLESDGRVYVLVILTPDPPWTKRYHFMQEVDEIIKKLNP